VDLSEQHIRAKQGFSEFVHTHTHIGFDPIDKVPDLRDQIPCVTTRGVGVIVALSQAATRTGDLFAVFVRGAPKIRPTTKQNNCKYIIVFPVASAP